MLILILIDVQYLQNVVFNCEKGSNGQDHSSSVSHHKIKKNPSSKFPHLHSGGISPYPLTLFEKPCKVIFEFLFQFPCQAKFLGFFIVKDSFDQSKCRITERPIFHERVEA